MVVVDLDGTLIKANSFVLFYRFLFSATLRRWRLLDTGRICAWALLRRMRLISHRRFKWEIMKVADAVLLDGDYNIFAEELINFINPRVGEYVSAHKDVVLATAASVEYASELARHLGIRYCVATERPPSLRFKDYVECRGSEKVRRVSEALPDCRITEAITDHMDDLPLLLAAYGKQVLVNPASSTLAAATEAGLKPEIWE